MVHSDGAAAPRYHAKNADAKVFTIGLHCLQIDVVCHHDKFFEKLRHGFPRIRTIQNTALVRQVKIAIGFFFPMHLLWFDI